MAKEEFYDQYNPHKNSQVLRKKKKCSATKSDSVRAQNLLYSKQLETTTTGTR